MIKPAHCKNINNVEYFNLMIIEVPHHSVTASITPNQSSVENAAKCGRMYGGSTLRISGGTTVGLMLFSLLNYILLGEKWRDL